MANPTRISDLVFTIPQLGDQIPIARGAGANGSTQRIFVESILTNLLNAGDTSTVDMSFNTSTRTLCAQLMSPVVVSKGGTGLTTTPTNGQVLIGNGTTYSLNTLSAGQGITIVNQPGQIGVSGEQLLTLIKQLSSNMQNIGNYPYLEYAWVTQPNVAGQTIAANTITTLSCTNEIVDNGNYGSISNNQITLAAGTYTYIARSGWDFSSAGGNNAMLIGLYDITNSKYISRTGPEASTSSGDYIFFRLEGQFTITELTVFDIRGWCSAGAKVRNSGGDNSTITTLSSDQRTTLQLWKVA